MVMVLWSNFPSYKIFVTFGSVNKQTVECLGLVKEPPVTLAVLLRYSDIVNQKQDQAGTICYPDCQIQTGFLPEVFKQMGIITEYFYCILSATKTCQLFVNNWYRAKRIDSQIYYILYYTVYIQQGSVRFYPNKYILSLEINQFFAVEK